MFLILIATVIECRTGKELEKMIEERNRNKLNDSLDFKTKANLLVNQFSIRLNAIKVTRAESFNDKYSYLYGLRFFSMIWVILAHTYLFQNIMTVGEFDIPDEPHPTLVIWLKGNTFKLRDLPKNFFFQICLNGTLSAEVSNAF